MDLLLTALFVFVVILTSWLIYNRSSLTAPQVQQTTSRRRDKIVHKDEFVRKSDPSPFLDLHGFSVQEAKLKVEKFLKKRSDVYFNEGMRLVDRYIYIVIGQDDLSETDRASIQEYMISCLKKHGYGYKWRNPDEVEVDLL